jgi:hypothetical protein
MANREVLVTGDVGAVNGKGLFGTFSIVPDHGVPMYSTNSAYSLVKRLRPGQRVELVHVKHSWLWGKLRWSATYVRLTGHSPL